MRINATASIWTCQSLCTNYLFHILGEMGAEQKVSISGLHVLSYIDQGRKHALKVLYLYSVLLDSNKQNNLIKVMLNAVDGKNFFRLRFHTNGELIIVC